MKFDDEILDVIQLGKSKIRIIGNPETFIGMYSGYIINLENYDYIHVSYNPNFTCKYEVSIKKGGQNLLSFTEDIFHQFQKFVDLNVLLDLEPGTIEALFLETKMTNE